MMACQATAPDLPSIADEPHPKEWSAAEDTPQEALRRIQALPTGQDPWITAGPMVLKVRWEDGRQSLRIRILDIPLAGERGKGRMKRLLVKLEALDACLIFENVDPQNINRHFARRGYVADGKNWVRHRARCPSAVAV